MLGCSGSTLSIHDSEYDINQQDVWSNLKECPGMQDEQIKASTVDLKRHHTHIFFVFLLLLFSQQAAAEKLFMCFYAQSSIIIPGNLMSQAFV